VVTLLVFVVVDTSSSMTTSSAVTQQQPDAWYAALLGLAEHFRTSNPPKVRHCIQCLETVFTFKPPPPIEARTHLQIGTVLSNHTKNIDLALSHLDRAVSFLHLDLLLQLLFFLVVVSFTETL